MDVSGQIRVPTASTPRKFSGTIWKQDLVFPRNIGGSLSVPRVECGSSERVRCVAGLRAELERECDALQTEGHGLFV
jgi:hypothetical protein